MATANQTVIESNIPAAAPDRSSFTKTTNIKRRRELEDVTAWMEMQEEAELDLLLREMAGRGSRAYRREMGY